MKIPRPLLIFSQSDYLIRIVAINSNNGKQCRSRSVGFFRIRLIWIYNVCKDRVYPGSPASVAQLDAPSDWRPGGRGFNPRRGRQHSFVEIDHEIFSTVILSHPLIQEGQLSVSGERMCTILVNRLED